MADLFLASIILLLGFALMKRWFPTMFNYHKRFGKWALKGTASWLWKKPEKKGAASIRPKSMKWRP